MDFKINELENFKDRIIELKDLNVKSVLKNIFLDSSYTVYVLKNNKYIGTVNLKSLLNFDLNNIVDDNHLILNGEDVLNATEIFNHALTNNTFNFPIKIKGEIKKEYVVLERPKSLFSMDKERWKTLYLKNTKLSDYINSKYSVIAVCGSFATEITSYIKENCKNIKCNIISNSYEDFKSAVEKNVLIIDTNDELKELKTKLCNFINITNGKSCEYISLYDLCNNAELYYFKEFSEKTKVKSYFFLFPDVDTFINLNQQEQFRISFDKHYRYYYERLNSPEILSLVQKVFGDMYSDEFIKSRNHLSGLEFKNGICRLQDSNNIYCRASNGTRYTTDKSSYYRNCICTFGACFVYGATVDDSHTLASCLQRKINKEFMDYEIYNYGARNLSLYESLRIAYNLHLSEEDKLIFILTKYDYDAIKGLGYPVVNLKEMFDAEKDLHDFFLDEPIHCNHIATEKISNFIFEKIKSDLKLKINANSEKPVQRENLFVKQFDENDEQVKKYIEYLRSFKVDKKDCAIVLMHANPFTLGHYKLVEYATKRHEHVYVMVAIESNIFCPEDIFNMVNESCKDFDNVTVIRDRSDLINRQLFLPGYFDRDDNPNASGNTLGFVDFIGTIIKPALEVNIRYMGSEPVDAITQNMNREMIEHLPKYGMSAVEIPRFETENKIPYSAKTVRNALKRKDWETIKQMVHPAAQKILKKYEDLI